MNTIINKFIDGYIEGMVFAENLNAREDKDFIERHINFWYEHHANRYIQTLNIPALQAFHEGVMDGYGDVI